MNVFIILIIKLLTNVSILNRHLNNQYYFAARYPAYPAACDPADPVKMPKLKAPFKFGTQV